MYKYKYVLVCSFQQTQCEEQEQVKPRAFLTVFSPYGVGTAAVITSCYRR